MDEHIGIASNRRGEMRVVVNVQREMRVVPARHARRTAVDRQLHGFSQQMNDQLLRRVVLDRANGLRDRLR